jgi:hypothetical protein
MKQTNFYQKKEVLIMANVKATQKEMFNGMIAYFKGEETDFTNEEFVEFLEGRIEVLNRKSANRKTKVNEADEALKAAVLEVLASGEKMTVTAIMRANDLLGQQSNQKVSAILRKLIADGAVDKVKDKKTSLFFLVG